MLSRSSCFFCFFTSQLPGASPLRRVGLASRPFEPSSTWPLTLALSSKRGKNTKQNQTKPTARQRRLFLVFSYGQQQQQQQHWKKGARALAPGDREQEFSPFSLQRHHRGVLKGLAFQGKWEIVDVRTGKTRRLGGGRRIDNQTAARVFSLFPSCSLSPAAGTHAPREAPFLRLFKNSRSLSLCP